MALERNKQKLKAERERQATISAEKSRSVRDVADDRPDCLKLERRESASKSLEFFCRTYLDKTFYLPWSPDHRKMIDRLETAAREGGQFAYAMSRGSGKTSLAEAAALWADLYGLRRFITLLGSDQSSALEMLESLKVELSTNDLLDEDFHFACGPIRALEGIAHRCNGQLYNGVRTQTQWTKDMVVMPTVPGNLSSGAIIAVAGITGRIRGMKFKRADGQSARPDLVIADDPQTDESARSPSQVQQRERLITGAVLGLAGPGKKIAAVMPMTVIAPGDLADKFLDRKKHPEWQGERAKLMYALPENLALWEKYAEARANSLRAGNAGREATEFYRANREAMDAGALPAWPSRHNADEASAIQHAMNLKVDLGDAAFCAEYQNEPLEEKLDEAMILTADEIAAKVNGMPRGSIPIGMDHLTAFIDVQGGVLYWIVCGWGDGFTGSVLDFGTFPNQNRDYFAMSDARHTLARLFPKAGQEGQIYGGLEALTGDLLGRQWTRQDSAELKIGKCLIDANWGESTDTVYQFCRQTPHAAIVMPSHGKYVGASSIPFDQYTRREGEKIGHHWMIPLAKARRGVRHVLIDTNYWKSFIHARLRVAMGDKGSLSLWGRKPAEHRMLAEHLTAEYGVRTEGRGRSVIEWKNRPNRDNHGLDCIVGAAVAASMLGISLPQHESKATGPRKRVKLSELQKRKASA